MAVDVFWRLKFEKHGKMGNRDIKSQTDANDSRNPEEKKHGNPEK